ncbi:sensor histidine kinase [Actinomadura viridis]|uniref:sensor histidine kinase n=1 Tax=Actinomadura viridis TaxID=58110 RepID=UPI00367F0B30
MAAEGLGGVAGRRIGSTFRLLMQVRIWMAVMSMLLTPYNRQTLETTIVVVCIALLSWLGLVAWQQIVPWLLAYPLLIVIDVCVSYVVLVAGGVLGPFFLFTVVTSTVAGLLHRRMGVLLVCLMQVAVYYGAAASDPGSMVSFQTVVAMPAFYPICGFLGAKIRRLFDEHEELYKARSQAEVVAAAAEERARLAREMHDSLAKTLRGIAMSAEALPLWLARKPSRAEQEAVRIAAAAEIASREVRQLISDLREDVVQQPIDTVVGAVTADWARSSGVQARVGADPGVDLPLRTRYELVAILKEALENVSRHSGASAVDVRLTLGPAGPVLTVADDGHGFSASPDFSELVREGHYGLVGMRERAATVGARLDVDSRPGAGTTIAVTFPGALGEGWATDLEVA